MIPDCPCLLKKPRFQMSITSTLDQSELLLVYFIGALNV